MILKTKEFQEVANKILFAAGIDKNAANLEIITKGNTLFLNVTNKEYYVSVKFDLEQEEDFRAVVDANLFLNLISGITTETFEINFINQSSIEIKAGKSKYKLALIYETDKLMDLEKIKIAVKTIEMPISNDILMSILNVNSKELTKTKNLDVNELQRLYYIDETGCFTFANGACLNSFTLEKPVKLLLNERIVKLFKLFKEDVLFSYGYEQSTEENMFSIVTFETPTIYVAAKINCDDRLLSKIQGPCNATKGFITESYPYIVVLSSTLISAAISRLMLFTKNSVTHANMTDVPGTILINKDELIITDEQDNKEVIPVENKVFTEIPYEMSINLYDLKLVLESCKNEHLTFSCGNHRSIVITRGPINNLIPELKVV